MNTRWDGHRSVLCGNYILAVGSRLMAQLRNEEVVIVLSRVLRDLVQGKFVYEEKKSLKS